MVPSSRKFLLIASFAAVYLSTVITALPPIPRDTQLQDDFQDVTSDGDNSAVTTTTSPGKFSHRLIKDISKEKIDSSETDNTNLNETATGKRKPIFEVVDIVFRPFRPPSIVLVDFFAKSNDSSQSSETETPNEYEDSTESNGTASSVEGDGRDKIAVAVHGNSNGSQDTTTHFPGTKEGSTGKTIDSALNPDGDENDEDGSPPLISTTVASRSLVKKDGKSDNKERRKRETHQTGNTSNKDDDDDDAGESDNSPPKNGKVRPDGMTDAATKSGKIGGATDDKTSNPDVSNDDGDDDVDDNGEPRKTNSSKKGTVTIFLEILQLVPLTNSTASGDESDADISTTITPSGAAEDTPTDTPSSSQVIHSSEKANFNKKFPTPDSPTTTPSSRRKDVAIHKRVARSVTATSPPAAIKIGAAEVKEGNPSKSPAASASSPSSGATSKPPTITSPAPVKVAPAAPKAATRFPISDEGPPLENVTEPLGKGSD